MTHRQSARAHRQLVPTDVRGNCTSGAFPLHVIPEPGSSGLGLPGLGTVTSWNKRRVLLLNATFEPLTALPARRAVVLMVCDKADPVHEDPLGPVIHSEGYSLQVPFVIRLRNYVRVPYRTRVPMTRAALMHRDRFRCGYCGDKAETIDHVVPRSRGGGHSWENCVACCAPCNHRKADKLLTELGWTLRTALVPPSGPHWRLLSTTTEVHPTWLPYLGEGAA
ncbi:MULTISPECIES: HNH endonuclease [unclassified Rhodococcus (in: high G+C Gram-positive bacteria)]|uniref:HNH endonuclease n=1 Tax=unclassified Rhodococcus (in: high G+C Gram-positive bacteria) TaxID=192944 RepID=UPI000E09F9FA|nr:MULTISPECIES: HNH endonuclease [unclassified Rhodococcus (in: high G+C Gram-positive bacteria)]QKT12274.1 HNH endonuclease [Rhodococcus sp. W8901]RDI32283.1 5-methylcytosine-specific restriction endonuclease McrA [Rhodococcus sp. AG1013]